MLEGLLEYDSMLVTRIPMVLLDYMTMFPFALLLRCFPESRSWLPFLALISTRQAYDLLADGYAVYDNEIHDTLAVSKASLGYRVFHFLKSFQLFNI